MRMKGRPTDAIKDTTVKVRLDDHTRKMLAYCVEAMNLSKSELIRLCIAKEYDIILDSGSITDVLNSRDAFFDYIFGTENH